MLDNALAGKLVDRLAIDVQNLPGVGGFLAILTVLLLTVKAAANGRR